MAGDSLFVGVSGLDAQQNAIDVISNNIANVNTTGFKDQRVTFQDLLYQTQSFPTAPSATRGGTNATQDGLGVRVATTDSNFTQGGLETTGINTDLAINGDGFFVLGDLSANNAVATNPVYTRDGAFSLNENGTLYDPASGKAVLGFTANSAGAVTPSSSPGTIKIPIGLKSQAVGTGFGAKVGPTGTDQVFDAQFGGNLDMSQYLSAAQAAVGGGGTATPISISTTVYDSLGNPHLMTLAYTPDAKGATAATVASAGAGTNISAGPTINPLTTTADTITVTSNGPVTGTYTITDTLGNNITGTPGQQVTVGGATFTLTTPVPAAGGVNTITVTAGTSGLPTTVQDASGNARAAASRWAVNASFADGTTFSTISKAGTLIGGVYTAPTFGQNSSGTLGYAYFDQNGQFINTSAVETTTGANANLTNATYIHTASTTPSINQGNQLNIQSWGPGAAGNNATAPTAGGAAPVAGPIDFDFSGNTALSGSSTATTISQNGFTLGTLQNITVGQDGKITGAFSNGQSQVLAQLALATFQNEQGLLRQGSSQFIQSANSGLPQVGIAGTGRLGAVISGSLEQSNVSLADEFTKMIAAQRAFQANSASITTADQDLQTVIGLKR